MGGDTMRRRLILRNVSGGGLPSEYQQVEWIGFALGCFLDLGVISYTNPGFDIDFQMPSSRPGQWGPHIISSDTQYLWFVARASATSYYLCGTDNTTTIDGRFDPLTLDARHSASLHNSLATVDGVSKQLTRGNTALSGNVVVGAYGGDTTDAAYLFGGKIFALDFFDGNNLAKLLVPCYRKSDSTIGMYDTVNGMFYTNAGTGTFDKGADV